MIAAALGVVIFLLALVLLLGVLRIFGAVLAYRDRQALRRWHEQTLLAQAHAEAYERLHA